MHIRLSEATVDLSVMEHKIHRKKVGAGKNPLPSSRDREPQPRSKHLQKEELLPTRLLSSTAHLQHCLGEVKSSIGLLPTEIGSCCEISPKPCSGLRWRDWLSRASCCNKVLSDLGTATSYPSPLQAFSLRGKKS